jgi:hypothetical protein
MIQKSRWRLLLVGLLMICLPGLVYFVPFFWAPAAVLMLAGAYLVVCAERAWPPRGTLPGEHLDGPEPAWLLEGG